MALHSATPGTQSPRAFLSRPSDPTLDTSLEHVAGLAPFRPLAPPPRCGPAGPRYELAMPFFVRLPKRPDAESMHTQDECYINLINGQGTLIQRELRRHGFAGYEPHTASVACALWETLVKVQWPHRAPNGQRLCFFDIGANGGFYSFLCKGLHRSAVDVHSFEPAPDTYFWLEAINDVNGLGMNAHRLALSDRPGQMTLYLSAKSDASNSLNPQFKARHKGTVTIDCTTLDIFCRDHQTWPDVVKIDTETHEEQVLRGGADVLRTRRPFLILEAINKGGIDYGRRISSLLDEIGGYNYYYIGPNGLERRDHISATARAECRDWLISPAEPPPEFCERVAWWREALAECTASTSVGPRKTAVNYTPSGVEQGERGVTDERRADHTRIETGTRNYTDAVRRRVTAIATDVLARLGSSWRE